MQLKSANATDRFTSTPESIRLGKTTNNHLIDSFRFIVIFSCRKRGRTIHSLTNGIVVASSQQTNRNDLLAELTSDNSNDETFDMIDRQNSVK